MILAAVRANYSSEILSLLTHAVHVIVPREIRLQRIRERSLRKFGTRALPGGDLHDQEEQFFLQIAQRPDSHVHDWLAQTTLPVIEVDGMLPAEENVKKLLPWIYQ